MEKIKQAAESLKASFPEVTLVGVIDDDTLIAYFRSGKEMASSRVPPTWAGMSVRLEVMGGVRPVDQIQS